MKRYLVCTVALAMPLLVGGAALAQSPAAQPPAAPPSVATAPPVAPGSQHDASTASAGSTADLSAKDKSFVEKAAQGGVAEVQMAQLAQQKASSDDVKKFAQTMIDEHTPNNEQLAKLASGKGLEPPTDPDAAQQKMLSHLQALSGDKFDKAYIKGQVKAHTAMLKLFKAEAKSGKDSDLKGFADQTVPTIEHHLSMAQDLSKSGA